MNIKSFSANLQPGSAFAIKSPTEDLRGEETRIAPAGNALLRVVMMPLEERVALLTEQAADEVLVLFAMLSPKERRDVLRAAETFLKEKIVEV